HFFIYAVLFAAQSFLVSLVYTHVYFAATKQFFLISVIIGWSLSYLFLLSAVYKMFDHYRGMIYWSLVSLCLLSLMLDFIYYNNGYDFIINILPILIFLEITRTTRLAA